MASVKIITFKGCQPTIDFQTELSVLAKRDGIALDISLEVVPSPEKAEEMGLFGSPTILIDGKEIDPESHGPAGFY